MKHEFVEINAGWIIQCSCGKQWAKSATGKKLANEHVKEFSCD